jgi:phage FluMu protein Com
MTYKIKCPECKKIESYTTDNAESYIDDNGDMVLYWECPHCLTVVEAVISWIRK